MTNAALLETYERVYREGTEDFFTVDSFEESLAISEDLGDVRGKTIIEVGCGEGRLAALLAMRGARTVHAIDYSQQAISTAQQRHSLPNLAYSRVADFHDIGGTYDSLAMQGVLEHLDDPWRDLLWMWETWQPSRVVAGCPSFLNPRGYVWMALHQLLRAPMSLTDLHFLHPRDFQRFANDHGAELFMRSIHGSWGYGETLLKDFRKRLPNALRDAGLPTDGVPKFLDWLQATIAYERDRGFNGATMIYRLERKT